MAEQQKAARDRNDSTTFHPPSPHMWVCATGGREARDRRARGARQAEMPFIKLRDFAPMLQ